MKSLAASRSALALAKSELARKVDEAAAARAEAVEANRAKSAFLAQMSHELRTPLNAVIGFSEVIAKKDDVFDDPTRIDTVGYAGHIHSSGRHLLSLVNDILDLAKIESGKFSLALETLDLRDVVKDAIGVTRAMADERGQTIRLEAHPGMALVEVDERATLQILLNLLSNAVKYSPAGALIHVEIQYMSDHAMILIADQGPGMTDEQVKSALEPYARLDREVVRAAGGTGLGLPIVNALIELHGGRLDFQPRAGGGTLVTVTLPLSAAEQNGESVAA